MNKHKISKNLLYKTKILESNINEKVFVYSKNFSLAKQFLNSNQFKFSPHRFANCFSLSVDNDDLDFLSNQNCVDFIFSNNQVYINSLEKDFLHMENLTKNKFLGQNQTICFIDTGISPHFDFIFPRNRIVKFVDFINSKTFPYDDNGHGTFVAGTACGGGIFSKNYTGIAPMANIISLKALGENGSSNSDVILDAMEWIFQHQKAFNISIVCMSFGADAEENLDPLSKGAEALWKQGLTIVAAAGNDGPKNNTIKSPGNCPYIITVGALDTVSMSIADFSSRGPTIYGHKPDLLAPAVDIVSCNKGKLPYKKMSGTSVATPIIAGICACIKSKRPSISNAEIKKFLISNCKPITGDIDTEGAGYINFGNL